MSRPEPTFGLAAIAAAQAISLDLLRAEMAALAMLLPGKADGADGAGADGASADGASADGAGADGDAAREAAHDAAFEAGIDDMPV
ncbi:MAG: hypothetical protein RIR62_2222 [Pseudomonadota bacterium]|jgi:hypothetical protein